MRFPHESIEEASIFVKVAQSSRIVLARKGYLFLGWLFVACVVVQVFLAGMGTFVSPIHFANHATFVHIFEYLPLIMLALAFAGQLSTRLRWMTAGLFALIAVQYATANARHHDFGFANFIASLHPVTALALFWASIVTLLRARREADTRPTGTKAAL